MLDYRDAIREFGEELADMMLECEYNQYVRGREDYNPLDYHAFDEGRYTTDEELCRVAEEF